MSAPKKPCLSCAKGDPTKPCGSPPGPDNDYCGAHRKGSHHLCNTLVAAQIQAQLEAFRSSGAQAPASSAPASSVPVSNVLASHVQAPPASHVQAPPASNVQPPASRWVPSFFAPASASVSAQPPASLFPGQVGQQGQPKLDAMLQPQTSAKPPKYEQEVLVSHNNYLVKALKLRADYFKLHGSLWRDVLPRIGVTSENPSFPDLVSEHETLLTNPIFNFEKNPLLGTSLATGVAGIVSRIWAPWSHTAKTVAEASAVGTGVMGSVYAQSQYNESTGQCFYYGTTRYNKMCDALYNLIGWNKLPQEERATQITNLTTLQVTMSRLLTELPTLISRVNLMVASSSAHNQGTVLLNQYQALLGQVTSEVKQKFPLGTKTAYTALEKLILFAALVTAPI